MERDPLTIAIAVAFPIALLMIYRKEIGALTVYGASAALILAALAPPLLLLIRRRGPRATSKREVILAKINIYDKNTSINVNKIKEIAESMGIGAALLSAVNGGRRVMGRSLGSRVSYGMLIWADGRGKEGREVIRAAVSAINSSSEGFKLEIIERRIDPEVISLLLGMPDVKEPIPVEVGREERRSELLIEIGERRGKVISIGAEELTKHVLIAGQTGSGKTTTAKRIVYEAWNLGIPSLIMDSHWEYRNLVLQLGGRVFFNRQGYPQVCVNPLASIPRGEKEVFLVAETLSTLLDLTPSQFYILLKALRRLSDLSTEKNPPNMLDLIVEVKAMASSSQPEEESKAALIRKLEPLISGDGETLFSCDNILSTGFEDALTLVELGDVESDLQKQLLATFILKKVKDRFIREEEKSNFPRLLIVLEEAEKLIPKYKDSVGFELVSRLFAELRKFGISLVMVSQSLSEVPEAAIRNTGVKLIHRVDSPSDLRLLRGSGERGVIEKARTLMPGECILMAPYSVEVLQVRAVDELPLRRERADDLVRTNSFYWPLSQF